MSERRKKRRKRTAHLSVRFLPEEIERLRRVARGRGLAPSTYVRFVSLGETLPKATSRQAQRDALALLVAALPVLEEAQRRFSRRRLAGSKRFFRALRQVREAARRLSS